MSEDQVKITKAEALFFLNGIEDATTPQEYEMYTDQFGYVDGNGDVYLG